MFVTPSDKNAFIVSLSFGVARDFRIKRNGGLSQFVPLQHGDIFVMDGLFQTEFTHAIDEAPRVTQGRINFTFRFIMDESHNCQGAE